MTGSVVFSQYSDARACVCVGAAVKWGSSSASVVTCDSGLHFYRLSK